MNVEEQPERRDAAAEEAAVEDRRQASARSAGETERLRSGERQRTIDVLCEAFANDELDVEEFERRVAEAHRAESARDLRRLLAGLPSGQLPASRSTPAPVPESEQPPSTVATPAARPRLADPREVGAWTFTVGVMGAMVRSGHWAPARRNVVVAFMGGCELDFREAALPPGVTEVHAVASWGGIEIVVPPWLRVETSGVGLMGGFDYHHDASAAPDPGGPVLRISGLALMGGVDVAVRLPGESARDAKKRRRSERKARRLASGRREA